MRGPSSRERVDRHVAQFGPGAGERIGARRAAEFQRERESGRHDPLALTLMDLAMNTRACLRAAPRRSRPPSCCPRWTTGRKRLAVNRRR